MKLALINDNKVEASKGAKGLCPNCGSELIAKCGEVKINHWAHKGSRNCDVWWENETEWHRTWKNTFPLEWQEVIQCDKKGEKHIADVKTQEGYELEFQHSYLNPEERRSRNVFYQKLVWVVDGTRRKRDKIQFQRAIEQSTVETMDATRRKTDLIQFKSPRDDAVDINLPSMEIRRLDFPEECRLLKEWHDGDALVFFDFQDTKEMEESALWLLFPKLATDEVYVMPFSRQEFIKAHNQDTFDEIVSNTITPKHEDIKRTLHDLIQEEQKRKESHPTNKNSWMHPDLYNLYSKLIEQKPPNTYPQTDLGMYNNRRRRKRL